MRVEEREVAIPVERGSISATWTVPDHARGVVVFAHGTGSGRRSARNRFLAGALQEAGFATLLLDLLTVEEEETEALSGYLRIDVDLLTRRLAAAVAWLGRSPEVGVLPVGIFGASTGTAAALRVAADNPGQVLAVVSRGGRPDLAGEKLRFVRSPVLLIVGGDDDVVLTLNERALTHVPTTKELIVVPHATRSFEEPGALGHVAELARRFFDRFLALPPLAVVEPR